MTKIYKKMPRIEVFNKLKMKKKMFCFLKLK